jgi:hypothetical protein
MDSYDILEWTIRLHPLTALVSHALPKSGQHLIPVDVSFGETMLFDFDGCSKETTSPK